MPVPSIPYEEPTVLSAQHGHLRIFAQSAYRTVRRQQCAPILISEAAQLAQYFPLCWHETAAGLELVALRSLLPEGEGHLRDAHTRTAALPIALQAFPIVIPDADALERQRLLFDSTIADKPTDIGAPLLLASGRLSKAALQRAQLAVAFARALPDTTALTDRLDAAALLEPWPLDFDLGDGSRAVVPGLKVIAASRLRDPALYDLVAELGAAAGLFMSLQRASLFRIGVLLSAAKAAAASRNQAGAG